MALPAEIIPGTGRALMRGFQTNSGLFGRRNRIKTTRSKFIRGTCLGRPFAGPQELKVLSTGNKLAGKKISCPRSVVPAPHVWADPKLQWKAQSIAAAFLSLGVRVLQFALCLWPLSMVPSSAGRNLERFRFADFMAVQYFTRNGPMPKPGGPGDTGNLSRAKGPGSSRPGPHCGWGHAWCGNPGARKGLNWWVREYPSARRGVPREGKAFERYGFGRCFPFEEKFACRVPNLAAPSGNKMCATAALRGPRPRGVCSTSGFQEG